MANFTDLLDEYLSMKEEVKVHRKNYEGYDFSYFFARELKELENAEKELNEFVNSFNKETPHEKR